MFEGAAGPPDYAAMSFPFYARGAPRADARLPAPRAVRADGLGHLARLGARARPAGRSAISYDLNDEDLRTFKRGIELLCELLLGGRAPRSSTRRSRAWACCATATWTPLRRHDLRPRDLTLMAFHPLGTARADARPQHGVVDGDLKLHGTDGLYVSDASVMPSSLGVNPQITIMALATRLAYDLLGKPAPVDEPEPEKIARPRITRLHHVTA